MGNTPPCLEKPIQQLEKSFHINQEDQEDQEDQGLKPLENLIYTILGFSSINGKLLTIPGTDWLGVNKPIEKDKNGKVQYWLKMLSIFLNKTKSELSDEFKKSWQKATLQPSGSIQIKKTNWKEGKNHRIIFIFNEMGTKCTKEWILWFGSEASRKLKMVEEAAAILYPDQNIIGDVLDIDGFFKLGSSCMFNGQKIDRIWMSRVDAKTTYKQYVLKKRARKKEKKRATKKEKKRIKNDLEILNKLNKKGYHDSDVN